MGNCNCFTSAQRLNKSKDVMIEDIPDSKSNNLQKEKPFESNYSVDPHSSIKTYKDNKKTQSINISNQIK
jgi:hypothetical protein